MPRKPAKRKPPVRKPATTSRFARPVSKKQRVPVQKGGTILSEGPAPDPAIHGVGFPVVGVGASAGGLEAFTQLLLRLPTDTGMAFVLVQHLHPEYESALTEILSRATSMPVAEAVDGLAVEPDHVYVIPPNVYLAVLHGVLHLQPRTAISGQNLPIDHFFRSLADDQGSKAIGVILSGTASDGAAFDNYLITHVFENIGSRTVAVSGRRIPSGPTSPPLVLMQIEAGSPSASVAGNAG